MIDYRALQAVLQRMSHEEGPFQVVTKTIGGVQYPVYKSAPESLRELLDLARPHGDRDFLVYADERLSFKQALASAAELAYRLVHELGVRRGERVAIAMRNYPEWAVAFMGIVAAGAVAVPLNAWWGEKELGYAIDNSGARWVFADEQRLARLQRLLIGGRLRAVAVRTPGPLENTLAFDALVRGEAGLASWPEVAIAAEDPVSILYTSGSTGHPKGVVSSHRALVHTLCYWFSLSFAVQELLPAAASPPAPQAQPAVLLAVPLFHVTGCHSCFLGSLLPGRKVVFMHKWNAADALHLIEAERITSFNGVPTMSMELLTAPERRRYDLSCLTDIGGSGAATPPERIRQMAAEMPTVAPVAGFGMTETNALGCLIGGEEYRTKPASVGLPNYPLVEVRLLDEQGREVAPGEPGEVCFKSVTNMDSYWNQPQATVQTLRDGWLHSGDIGRLDEEGYLYIVGRLKEIIIRGGENISCNEVEAAIYEHPDVFEVAVYGVPDARLGEAVAASITARPGRRLVPAELRAFLEARLAKYKMPAHFDLRAEPLPKIASGKIARRRLQQEFVRAPETDKPANLQLG